MELVYRQSVCEQTHTQSSRMSMKKISETFRHSHDPFFWSQSSTSCLMEMTMAAVQSDLWDVIMYDGSGGGVGRMRLTIRRGGSGGGGSGRGVDWVSRVVAAWLLLQSHTIHLTSNTCFSKNLKTITHIWLFLRWCFTCYERRKVT